MVAHAVFWAVYLAVWVAITRRYIHAYDGWLTQVVQTNEKEIRDWYSSKFDVTAVSMLNKRQNYLDEIARKQLVKVFNHYIII